MTGAAMTWLGWGYMTAVGLWLAGGEKAAALGACVLAGVAFARVAVENMPWRRARRPEKSS